MFSRGADFGECRPGKEGEMTVSPGEQEDIRRMDRDGVPRSRIARELGVRGNTVAKHADMRDVSPEPPLARRRARPAAASRPARPGPAPAARHWTHPPLRPPFRVVRAKRNARTF